MTCLFLWFEIAMEMSEQVENRKGFTTPEKWIIWGVFCSLIGLSTYRFTVFLGLMIVSIGIYLIRKKEKLALAVLLCLVGLLNIVFSKFLI